MTQLNWTCNDCQSLLKRMKNDSLLSGALRPRLDPFSEARLLAELRAMPAHMFVNTESVVRFIVPPVPTEFQQAICEICGLRVPRRGQLIDPPGYL